MTFTPIYEQFPAIADAIRGWAAPRGLVVEFSDHRGNDFVCNRFSAMITAPHLVMTEGPGAGGPYRLAMCGIDPRGDDPAATVKSIEDEWDRGLASYGVVGRRAASLRPPAPA
jgi:hypothetical protein